MALKASVDFKGITIPNVYIKINSATVFPSLARVELFVHYMADNESAPFHSRMFMCAYDIEGENPVRQGYDYMKTLEEFMGAEEC